MSTTLSELAAYAPASSIQPGKNVLIRYSVLIVDHVPQNRKLVEEALHEDRSFEVFTATDARSAAAVLNSERIDLVMIESNLVHSSGFELCRRIKTYEGTERIAVVMMTSMNSVAERNRAEQAGAEDLIARPFLKKELVRRLRTVLKVKMLQDQLEEVEDAAFWLSALTESRDQYTKSHTRRVVFFAGLIGTALQLNNEDMQLLRRAAYLHDIGKAGVPDDVLNKQGPLTDEEMQMIREVPLVDAERTGPFAAAPRLLPILRHLYERPDGSGCPDGLFGDQIPLGSRIIALADAYDAMTSARPYRPAMPISCAQAILRKGAGTQWDAELVNIFLRVLDQHQMGEIDYFSTKYLRGFEK